MDTAAIIMMVLFLLVIWGGLALSIVHFVRHPDGRQGETDDGSRPVLAGGAVDEGPARARRHDLEGSADRVGAVPEVPQVVLAPVGLPRALLTGGLLEPGHRERLLDGDLAAGLGASLDRELVRA